MDLGLFAGVLWRFRIIVAVGLVVALALAVLSAAQVTFKNGVTLRYRTPTFYRADSILFVTQTGFPWGKAVQPYVNGDRAHPPVLSGDQQRLTNLAQVYAQYANSDIVAAILAKDRLLGTVNAQPMITNPNVGAPTLPLIDLSATASTQAGARRLAQGATTALISYLNAQMRAAGIAPSDRVVIQQLQRPTRVAVVQQPKKTIPILVFITVMLAACGLAFVLENLQRRPVGPTRIDRERDDPWVVLAQEPRHAQQHE